MAEKPYDLMTFLELEYRNAPEESRGDFTMFCRNYLAKTNIPVNIVYMPVGLGLKLQQGQVVCFDINFVDKATMRDEGIRITNPMSIPGMNSIVNTNSIPITGKGE